MKIPIVKQEAARATKIAQLQEESEPSTTAHDSMGPPELT
jgi:hypothetical protein